MDKKKPVRRVAQKAIADETYLPKPRITPIKPGVDSGFRPFLQDDSYKNDLFKHYKTLPEVTVHSKTKYKTLPNVTVSSKKKSPRIKLATESTAIQRYNPITKEITSTANPGMTKDQIKEATSHIEQGSLKDYAKDITAFTQFFPHPIISVPSMMINSGIGINDALENEKKKQYGNEVINTAGALPWAKMIPGWQGKVLEGISAISDLTNNFGLEQQKNGGWLDKYQDGVTPAKAQLGKKVTIDGKEYDTSSDEYRDLYRFGPNQDGKGGIGYFNEKGQLVTNHTTLPEVVISKKDKDTQAFYDELSESDRYAFDQMTKKYGPVNITSNEGKGLFSGTSGHYNPFGNQITINESSENNPKDTYIAELSHKVQFDKQGKFDVIGDWIFNDLPDYIMGNKPYGDSSTMEYEAHSKIQPGLEDEFSNYSMDDITGRNYNKFRNGGRTDNYGKKENANEGHSSAPKEWRGEGYSNVGRNYSPAWGGQFEEGGEIPKAQKGKRTPIYTEDPRKVQAYTDSLGAYNNYLFTDKVKHKSMDDLVKQYNKDNPPHFWNSNEIVKTQKRTSDNPSDNVRFNPFNTKYAGYLKPIRTDMYVGEDSKYTRVSEQKQYSNEINVYKEPVQPYILQKPKSATRPPIYTNDPNDPRIRAYADSSNLYNDNPKTVEHPLTGTDELIFYMRPKDFKIRPIGQANRRVITTNQNDNPGFISTRSVESDYVYKKPVQPYILQQEPKLHGKQVTHIDPISTSRMSTPGLRTIQQPNIELPAVERGQYRTSYYDPQMKDWNERAFMTQQESDQFADEMSKRGYPGSYGNVTQRTQYQLGGNVYPVNYVPQAQEGLTFLEPTSPKLPSSYIIPYRTPSSERARSIGGEEGEPAFLIPEFKYGHPLENPDAEFRKTGEHLGGPFKTWQEADEWGRTVRHPYVEKGQDIPTPLRRWGKDFAMGGNLPTIPLPQPTTNSSIKTTGGKKNKNNKWLLGAGLGLGIAGLLYALLDKNKSKNSSTDSCQTGMRWDEETQQCVQDPTYERIVYYPKDKSYYTNVPEEGQGVTPIYDDSIVLNYTSPETNYIGNDLEAVNSMRSTAAMGASIPGSVGFTYARTGSIPSNGSYAKKTKASAQNGKEMRYYQEGLDWKPKSISKNGDVVKDDNGYWNPDNWGKVVEINSPIITMKGVDQDLIGVSDEGDVQYMTPGKNYKFKGKKVREYPVGKNGVNQQDEKVAQQLDQLTNFTNYNKPTIGGWLDKYN